MLVCGCFTVVQQLLFLAKINDSKGSVAWFLWRDIDFASCCLVARRNLQGSL
jgi:hypothetical protein